MDQGRTKQRSAVTIRSNPSLSGPDPKMPNACVRLLPLSTCLLALFLLSGREVAAQPLGSFSWQLQPFCNRVTLNVVQTGAVYTMDGWDDQCGAAARAPIVGSAILDPGRDDRVRVEHHHDAGRGGGDGGCDHQHRNVQRNVAG